MKILFLQQTDNALGGVTNVNINLARAFLKDGHEVKIICTRHGLNEPDLSYPEGTSIEVINSNLDWNCPRLNQAIPLLKKGKFISIIQLILTRKKYDQQLKEDYEKEKKRIADFNPDAIIVTHYELLDAISEDFLRKVLVVHHNTFNLVTENFSFQNYFNNYKDKIHKFAWLTKSTRDKAIAYGYKNSTYVHNAINFSSDEVSSLDHQKAIFIGRFSEQKRVDLLIDLFKEANIEGWTLEIYGYGHLENDVITHIGDAKNVILKGKTSNPKEVLLESDLLMLSSSFEGLPLVIIEANECGVPAITFNYGEGIEEVIEDNQTGIIVDMDNHEQYIKKLRDLLNNPELLKQMGKNAKQKAKEFSIETIKNEWYQLFNEIKGE